MEALFWLTLPCTYLYDTTTSWKSLCWLPVRAFTWPIELYVGFLYVKGQRGRGSAANLVSIEEYHLNKDREDLNRKMTNDAIRASFSVRT